MTPSVSTTSTSSSVPRCARAQEVVSRGRATSPSCTWDDNECNTRLTSLSRGCQKKVNAEDSLQRLHSFRKQTSSGLRRGLRSICHILGCCENRAVIVERLVRRGMGGRSHGRRLHAAKESDSGDGDGDSLDPGAIVVLNELIIGERKNTFFV